MEQEPPFAHEPRKLLRDGLLQRGDLQSRPPQDAARGRSEEMGTPGGAGRGEHRGRRHLRLGGCGFEANEEWQNQKDERQLAQISQSFGG